MSLGLVGCQLVLHLHISIGTTPHSLLLGDNEKGEVKDQSDSPNLSRCCSACIIWVITFYGVVVGDHLLLGASTTFYHLIISHPFLSYHSVIFHPFHLADNSTTFLGGAISLHLFITLSFFLSLIFSSLLSVPLAPGHLGWFPVWVATPPIHPYTRAYSRRNPGSLLKFALRTWLNKVHSSKHPFFVKKEALPDIYLLLPV